MSASAVLSTPADLPRVGFLPILAGTGRLMMRHWIEADRVLLVGYDPDQLEYELAALLVEGSIGPFVRVGVAA